MEQDIRNDAVRACDGAAFCLEGTVIALDSLIAQLEGASQRVSEPCEALSVLKAARQTLGELVANIAGEYRRICSRPHPVVDLF